MCACKPQIGEAFQKVSGGQKIKVRTGAQDAQNQTRQQMSEQRKSI